MADLARSLPLRPAADAAAADAAAAADPGVGQSGGAPEHGAGPLAVRPRGAAALYPAVGQLVDYGRVWPSRSNASWCVGPWRATTPRRRSRSSPGWRRPWRDGTRS